MASLKRATIPVWAINQLARQRPDAIDDLIKTHRSLARAKDPQKLRDLSRHRRELVGALTDQARDLLIDAGHAPSRQTIDRISSTLLATSSPEEEDLLKKGHLERELTPGGFEEAFTDLPAFEDAGGDASTEAKERAKKEMRDLAAEARDAKDKARALSRDAARLRRDADGIDNEARRWTRRAEQLEKKIKDLEG